MHWRMRWDGLPVFNEKELTRAEAKALGLKTYTGGKPCKNGHGTERLTSNGGCVVCCRKRTSEWVKANPEKHKEYMTRWREANPEKHKEYMTRWREANPEKNKEYVKRWREANPGANYKTVKKWRNENRDKYNAWSKKWRSQPEAKVSIVLRNTLRRMQLAGLEGREDVSSKDVGYTPSDLVEHIEALWQEGMTWDNYGEWHIDHIKPVSAFIREGIIDPAIVNALSNLQPLWATDNLEKSDNFS